MNGFIKLYRKFIDWEWYTDINTKIVFIHLLLIANHKDTRYKGNLIKRGQCIISYTSLEETLDLTRREIRTALEHLLATGEIDRQTTNRYTLITVRNYELYQHYEENEQQENDKQTTSKRQANDKQATPPEETKELENINNINNIYNTPPVCKHTTPSQKRSHFIPPSVEEVKQYCLGRHNNVNAEKFVDYYTANGWCVGKNKMRDWQAAVRMWEKNHFDDNRPNNQGRSQVKQYSYEGGETL